MIFKNYIDFTLNDIVIIQYNNNRRISMAEPRYTNKQDVINKGIIKKNGTFYRQTLLEIWYAKGWLELSTSRYGSEDRLRYGLKFMLDYYIVNRENLHSSHMFNDKVDLSGRPESMSRLEAQDRYRRAVRSVPAEFWPIVRAVCLEEREPVAPPDLSERQKAYFYFLCRTDLCRGLDRIIDIYTPKN